MRAGDVVLECAKQNLQKCYSLPSKFMLLAGMPPLALVYGVTFPKAAAGICLLHLFCCISFLASWLGLPFPSSTPTSPIFDSFLHSCVHSSVHPCLSLAATV